jgi:alpha-L-rhamnosidase
MEQAEADRPEVHALFRKSFYLGSVPERAPARITADSRYLLYLNGCEVFRGPIRS